MARVQPRPVPKVGQPNPPEGMRAITDDEGYHYCKEYIHNIAGTYSGVLQICGGGRDMWDDYKRFKDFNIEHDVLAVNIAGLMIPNIQHLYSLHFKQIVAISNFRKAEYPGTKHITHAGKAWEGIDYDWFMALRTSTSGYMAAVLGYLLGYRKMVLCGVPMDGSGYFYKPMINPTFGDMHRQEETQRLKTQYGQYVRSMSGTSAEILGRPDADWLKEKANACTI